jgi:exopolysaccharide biosynthesis polyprenyl glycosylphosphotransferase
LLKQNSRFVDAGLRILDLLVLAAAFPAAYLARNGLRGGTMASIDQLWPLLALALLLWMVTSWIFDVYDGYRTRPVSTELWRLARSVLVVTLVVTAASFFGKRADLSRLFVALYFALAFLLMAGNRMAVRSLGHAMRRRGYNARIFAVVGSSEFAEDAVRSMTTHPEWGYRFAGYVLEDDASPPRDGGSVLGRLGQLGTVLESQVLDEVVFAVSHQRLDEVQAAARLCEEQGVSIKICIDNFGGGAGRMTLSDIDGLPMLAYSTAPSDELALLAKRMFDVAVSAAVLALLFPLFPLVAIAIRLDSQGPVLFRQRRVGLHGREFTFYKFRSMRPDAEVQLQALRALNEASGPVFKMRNDPRVTRLGRLIRRTSIDELPQLWNVLKGEMSIVGPRPPLPSEVRQYKRWQRRRLSVKPGITCTWQVSGRSDIDFDRWMELDLEYIDHWSLWRDIEICFRTIPAVFTSRGAR